MGCGDWTVYLLNPCYEKCKYTGAGGMGESVVYVNKREVKQVTLFWLSGANRLRRNALQIAGVNTLDYNTR